MKKHLLIFGCILFFTAQNLSAQYCGNSGSSVCTPSGTLTTHPFTPNENIPCIVRGQSANTVIEISNFDTISFGGQVLTVQTMKIDTIESLPGGLCWATNVSNNTFANQAAGCLRISGVTYAQPGQYKLRIIATLNVGVPIQTNLDATNAKVFLRVINTASSPCPLVDTSSTNTFEPTTWIYSEARVSGKIYFDVNQNHVFDGTEQPVRNQLLSVGNGYMAFTNLYGDYAAYLPPAAYTVNPQLSDNLTGFAFNPDSLVVHADSIGVDYSGNNFGVIAPPNYCEGSLAIVANNPPPRPGFNNTVYLTFHNSFSTTAVSQNVRFYYSNAHVFVNANPSPVLVDTANRFIEWSVSNVNAGTNWQANLTFYTPVTTTINTVLYLSSTINNSSCSSLDTLVTRVQQTVVGSYDPNDKAVSPVGEGAGGHILPSSELTYTIRFQNTGTYMAENVSVIDTISSYLNISSLKVLAASANYEVAVSGREVTFRFSQINLPDSNTNEPNSHGYIQYSINPNNTFVQNNVVQNTAYIYFDFNSPIVTNTTTSTADNFVGMQTIHTEDLKVTIYPNPATDMLNISIDETLLGSELNIYDVTGRKIKEEKLKDQNSKIETGNLTIGVYVAEIIFGNVTQRVKWVKM